MTIVEKLTIVGNVEMKNKKKKQNKSPRTSRAVIPNNINRELTVTICIIGGYYPVTRSKRRAIVHEIRVLRSCHAGGRSPRPEKLITRRRLNAHETRYYYDIITHYVHGERHVGPAPSFTTL